MYFFFRFLGTLRAAAGRCCLAESRSAPSILRRAGATFPYPIYAKWAEAIRQKRQQPQLQSIVPAAASGRFRTRPRFWSLGHAAQAEELEKTGWCNFDGSRWRCSGGQPPGIKPGEIKLTGADSRGIYLGKIKEMETIRS